MKLASAVTLTINNHVIFYPPGFSPTETRVCTHWAVIGQWNRIREMLGDSARIFHCADETEARSLATLLGS